MVKNLYNVTLKVSYYDPKTYHVVANTSDEAIDRARVQAWKERKWNKKSDHEVTNLLKTDMKVVV